MIISHDNKFTLLRVPKTGSTSLEASVRFCGAVGKDDICSETEDAFLPSQNISETAKKYIKKHYVLKNIIDQKKIYELDYTEQEKVLMRWNRKWALFMEHNTLDDFFDIPYFSELNFITEEQVAEYKHYGFLREPIERYLSSFIFYQNYRVHIKKSQDPVNIETFHDFTLNELENSDCVLWRPQKEYFYFKGEQVSKPLLFKNWASEASRMIKEIGFHPLAVYPRFKENGNVRKRPKSVKPTVTDWVDKHSKIKKHIEEFFYQDIEFYKKYA